MRHSRVPRPETIALQVDGKTIAGIRHRIPDSEPQARLLCVHGWLDNANSFLPLMPLLPEVDLVAIDLPGHGYSDHLDSVYSVPESAYWVAAVIKQLGWEQCHLAGHSLGGIIAPLVSVARPDTISSLILIESSGALTSEADEIVQRLRTSINERLQDNKYASRVYKDKNAAVDARLRSARMDPKSARLIIDRQLSESDDGWRWRFDPKLRVSTAHRLTEAHVQEINAQIECPVLTILGKEGFLTSREKTAERLALIKNHQSVWLAGHHHLHMDTPEPVAAAINRFLGTTPALGG